MNTHIILEIIGYFASVLLILSLMMKSILRFRVLNLSGVIIFTLYGVMIKAYPIAILNGLMIFINLYFLLQILNRKDYFKILKVSYNSEYLNNFIDFYGKEIIKDFPDYKHEDNKEHLTFFVLRNMVPAGVLIADLNKSEALIVLDYVIPGYRDFGVGKFIFREKAGYFLKTGITRFIAEPIHKWHKKYLKRMGFKKRENRFVLELHSDIIQDDSI